MGYNKFLGVITLTFSLQPNLRHETLGWESFKFKHIPTSVGKCKEVSPKWILILKVGNLWMF
jgi:hypothetical protein